MVLRRDSDVDLQTNEGVLVPEPVRQAHRFTHQKDADQNRQLSGQNQSGLLSIFQRGRLKERLRVQQSVAKAGRAQCSYSCTYYLFRKPGGGHILASKDGLEEI